MISNDGYNLWLNYSAVSQKKSEEYASLISNVTVLGNSSLLDSAVLELQKALPVLLKNSGKKNDYTAERNDFSGKGLLVCPYSRLPYSIPLVSETIPAGDGFRIVKCSRKASFLSSKESDENVQNPEIIIVTSKSDRGVLYGVFAFLRFLQREKSLDELDFTDQPKINWRMLDHWDNPDGSIERGYAGKSLWKWNELPETVDERYTDYARFCASIGINASVLNNVNADSCMLKKEYLEKVNAIASVFRQYGITVFLSVNFASPITLGGLSSADPLDEKVIDWWKKKVEQIYSFIPDFGGFLVKADSEGQLGPYAYGRNHAEGANMLSSVLKPHGGIVIWRAFVYGQGETDRAKKAYADFKPLDGQFEENVAVQVKNGPIDFQPREPLHPLFGAMEKTALFMEFQVTQEYLGQEKHLVFLAPMWKEYLDWDVNGGIEKPLCVGEVIAQGNKQKSQLLKSQSQAEKLSGIAGVTNIGDDVNWCGSLFHPANWYAFGRLAWDYALSPEQIAEEWTECTWGLNSVVNKAVKYILMNSWNACVDYMTPLGLHHIMKFHHHYGPDPGCVEGEREDWRPPYYHRADKTGLGFDRTKTGSNAVSQYKKGLEALFADIEGCPEKYLLWFHHVDWNHVMKSGRTLKDELVFIYNRGVDEAEALLRKWESISDSMDGIAGEKEYNSVLEKLQVQVASAKEWRDVCTSYFLKFSELNGGKQ